MLSRTLLLSLLVCAWPACLQAAHIDKTMTLVEAIEATRSEGVQVSYSSRLVTADMRVAVLPRSREPLAALGEVLAPFGLELSAGRNGRHLVVRARPAEASIEANVTEVSRPARPAIDEITVIASHHRLFDRNGGAGQFLSAEEIELMPHLADDAFRALHKLPGVAANDFQAPFNLRGGHIGETGVRINGMEIIDPYHMRTLYRPLSIIDPGIIGEAELVSGGMTADMGNYLSGMVSIETDRLESHAQHELGVSFLTAVARSKGWFADGRGDYLVSVRRGWLDLIADKVADDSGELSPEYLDTFLQASYDLTRYTSVQGHLLYAADEVRFIDTGDGEDIAEDSSSLYTWITVDSEPTDRLRITGSVFHGETEGVDDGQQDNLPGELIFRRLATDNSYTGIETDIEYQIASNHLLKLGARYREYASEYDYDLDATRQTSLYNNGLPFFVVRDVAASLDGDDTGAYGAYRVGIGDALVLEAGLRWDRYRTDGNRSYSKLSPRLNTNWSLGARTELRVAWGEHYQPHYFNELDAIDGVVEWYAPEKAEHRIVGLSHAFVAGQELRVEVYDKRYRNPRPRFETVLDFYEFARESNFDRVLVRPTSAHAQGVEVTLQRRAEGSFDWWFSYAWAKVHDVVDDEEVPRDWDQRHAVTAGLTWRREPWRATVIGRYRSGWPRTPLVPVPVFDNAGDLVGVQPDLSGRNSTRFDNYSRVDVRVARDFDVPRGELTAYLEIFNIFDSRNPCCTSNHFLELDAGVSVSPVIDDYLPRFPSFGFLWRFGQGVN
ncbi:MAG: TonB-dependent receptor [Woeseiaceae bacterium]|nr:TonB-dependent receptor [Woeseiaceae bacterium]